MKLLLTSAGVNNPSIHAALIDLLGKPIADCTALCIPTAMYGHPMVPPRFTWNFISGNETENHMVDLGWKSVGVLELTALPSIDKARWVQWLQEADVLLASGGDAVYLAYWARQSGLADLLPTLSAVWVGMSAGSMVMTPRIGDYFLNWTPPTPPSPPSTADETLGLVNFSIFPHLDHPDLPHNTLADAERWATTIPGPSYAVDDQTAIRVVDGVIDVITEGHWKHLTT